jgi:hypothetical protein
MQVKQLRVLCNIRVRYHKIYFDGTTSEFSIFTWIYDYRHNTDNEYPSEACMNIKKSDKNINIIFESKLFFSMLSFHFTNIEPTLNLDYFIYLLKSKEKEIRELVWKMRSSEGCTIANLTIEYPSLHVQGLQIQDTNCFKKIYHSNKKTSKLTLPDRLFSHLTRDTIGIVMMYAFRNADKKLII